MDIFKANNFLVNSAMLPGMYAQSTYDTYTFTPANGELSGGGDGEGVVKNPLSMHSQAGLRDKDGERSYFLRAVYIPFDSRGMSCVDVFNHPGTHIPAILQIAPNNQADMFIIHFHGNACDAAQAGACAERESPFFNAHYLVAEYPGYGMADGFSSESLILSVVMSIYSFVVNDLKIDPSRIVIIGRSVGTGIAAFLSSKLQSLGIPPAALVLHSAYTGIRAVAADILGAPLSSVFLDRWNTFDKLCLKRNTGDKEGVATLKDTYGATQAVEVTTIGSSRAGGGSVRIGKAKMSSVSSVVSDTGDSEKAGKKPSTTDSDKEEEGKKKEKGKSSSDQRIVAAVAPVPKAGMLDLVPKLHRAPYSTVLCPVLFVHADQDSVIDYHHSVTLHARRSRDKLPSDLHTQRSSHYLRKDHNVFDYRDDFLVPVANFLDRKVKPNLPEAKNDAGGTSIVKISLPFEQLSQAAIIPAQYTSRHVDLMREMRSEERQREGGDGDGLAPPSLPPPPPPPPTSTSKPKMKKLPRPEPGPMGVVRLIASGCSPAYCARCCSCCFACFCVECNLALCSTLGSYLYWTFWEEEPDFVYATKAQRRGSGDQMNVSKNEVVEAPEDHKMTGEQREAAGIFERFAGLVTRPQEGQQQQQQRSEALGSGQGGAATATATGPEYVPG